MQVQSLGQEDSLEKEMANYSSIIAWTEEPGGLQFMGSQRVGHNLVTEHALTHWLKLTFKIILYVTFFIGSTADLSPANKQLDDCSDWISWLFSLIFF